MFTRLYVYVGANWKLMLTALFLGALVAAAIASQLQFVPQATLIAVNWEDRPITGGLGR